MKNYTLLTRTQYFQALIDGANAAVQEERVIVATMGFDPDEPMVADVAGALAAAAGRGAHVLFLIDAHDLMVSQRGLPGPLFYGHSLGRLRGEFAHIFNALQRIQTHGGRYVITNMPKRRFNPSMVGRSHIKGAVIGEHVFIGGCNLEKPKHIDVMVSRDDAYMATTLSNWFEHIAETGAVREAFGDVDTSVQIDATTTLVLDAGVPGQSLIYEEALEVIDRAQEWLYITCQYFPGGPTAKHLAAAQSRGVQVHIDYSHPRSHGSTSALQQLHQLGMRASGLPRNFFAGKLSARAPKLHAKIIASESEAIVGSHNYVVQGVQFGTAELALHSTDPAFGLALREHIKSQLGAFQPRAPRKRPQTV